MNVLNENLVPMMRGQKGEDGKSAYEIAVENGYEGSETEWLASLKGADGQDGAPGAPGPAGQDGAPGEDGKSAYEIAVENGYEGNETEWLASLKGADGQDGAPGAPGPAGQDGADGPQGTGIQDVTLTELPDFGSMAWADIAEISEAGQASQAFAVGDEKTIELTTGETITLVVLGFDHDDLADGSGKAGMTIGMKNVIERNVSMNETNTNAGGWEECEMRTTTMPEIFEQLPEDLQNAIKLVGKKTTQGENVSTIIISNDKLFLFSTKEISGVDDVAFPGEGEQYIYWQTIKDGTKNADRIKYLNDGGNAHAWMLRSPVEGLQMTHMFASIASDGSIHGTGASGKPTGISFGFCV